MPRSALRLPTAEYDRMRILDLFEARRPVPGAPFDEGHFLDFLLEAPRRPGAAFRSLRGRLRLASFIDALQLEFAICLSADDRRSNYPLADFVHRVGVLKRSRRSSLSALQAQTRGGFPWLQLMAFNAIAWTAAVVALQNAAPPAGTWTAGALAITALLVNAVAVGLHLKARAYRRRLLAEIRHDNRR